MKEKRLCIECRKEITNPKFCNHSCAAKYNNRKRIITAEQKSKTSNSVRMGWNAETPEVREKRRLSIKKSWLCPRRKEKQGITIRNYHRKRQRTLIKNLPFEELPPQLQRRVLFDENGRRCFECNYSYTDPKTGKGPFEIHHIDGNNKNGEKNNLQILCLNCHWKTDNYRFRGRTHTKEARKKMSLVQIKKNKNNL